MMTSEGHGGDLPDVGGVGQSEAPLPQDGNDTSSSSEILRGDPSVSHSTGTDDGGASEGAQYPRAARLPNDDRSTVVTDEAAASKDEEERRAPRDDGTRRSDTLPAPLPPSLEQHLEQSSASSPATRRRSPPARMASQSSQESWASSTQQPQQLPQQKQWYGSVRDLFRSNPTSVPLGPLRKLASQGCLDASHRGVSWRVLLGYIPTDRSQWSDHLTQQRQEYADALEKLFVHPMDCGSELKQQPRRPRQPLRHSSAGSSSSEEEDDDHHEDDEGGIPSTTSAESAVSAASAASSSTADVDLPANAVDAWKRSGRDHHVLVSVASGRNALRLPDALDNTAALDEFVKRAALLDEIRKDVNRTGCDLAFYLDPALGRRRHAALERILLVWASSSASFTQQPLSASRYVQGMNEIAAVLYFVLTALEEDDEDVEEVDEVVEGGEKGARFEGEREEGDSGKPGADGRGGEDPTRRSTTAADSAYSAPAEDRTHAKEDCCKVADDECNWADYAEPDAFWLFRALLGEMGDVFAPDLDGSATGIQGRINAMRQLLQRHDAETSEHLLELGIDTSFYAVRWWTTLLSREFLLPDTIRLWDSMFASTHKDNFIRYVCVTMVLVIRDDLLKGDFSTCLRMLQKYPPTNMEQLLQSSRALWVYESQVTVACHRGGITLSQALQTIAPPPGVVFAFGLRNGSMHMMMMPEPQQRDPSAAEQLSVAESTSWGAIATSGSAEQKMREATQAVASQAQVFLGRAMGFYRKYRSSINTNASSDRCDSSGSLHNSDSQGHLSSQASGDDAPQTAGMSSDPKPSVPELPPDHPDDSIYLEAILKA